MKRSRNFPTLVLFLGVCIHAAALAADREAITEPVRGKLEKLLKGKRLQNTGISIVDLSTGEAVYERNSEKPLKPASVLKLLTSAVALSDLGPDFRFQTKLFSEGVAGGEVQTLYVKGGGDPSFTTEDMWMLARTVKRRGMERVGAVVLDISDFATLTAREGQRAYEAGSSALALNFNSIAFEVCPSRTGIPAKVNVDPWELGVNTKGTIVTSRGRSVKFGIDELRGTQGENGKLTYLVKGSIGGLHPCAIIHRSVPDPAHYFGVVFLSHLRLLGVQAPDGARRGRTPDNATLVYSHSSKSLSQVIEDLNHYSSNFTSEQILTVLGTSEDGRKSREAGLSKLDEYIKGFGVSETEFRFEDGSGLSHLNRASARIFTTILLEMQRDEELKPEFEKSLSVYGRSGTLKKRKFKPKNIIVRGKTGTLNGVSSLAGYVVDRNGKKFAFAILQNGVTSKSQAALLEEKIVGAIY